MVITVHSEVRFRRIIYRDVGNWTTEALDISWASHMHPSQKLWPLEFVKSFRVQFWPSRYIMHMNRTSECNLITMWISREPPLFIFERLDISWASHIHPTQKLWPFEFSESFRVQFQVSRYIMCLNRTSEWNVLTIWISREPPLFIFERLDIAWAWHIHPSEKLSLFKIAESLRVQFWASRYIMCLNRRSEYNVMTNWIYR